MAAAHAGLPQRPPGLVAEAIAAPLAGMAAWLVWRRIDVGLERKRAALRRWGWLMLLVAMWPANPAASAPLLAASLGLAGWTGVSFHRIRPLAALLLLPFVAWLVVCAALLLSRV